MAFLWVSMEKKINIQGTSLPAYTGPQFLLFLHSPSAPQPGVHGSVFFATALGPQLSTEIVTVQLHPPDATQVSLRALALVILVGH